MLKVYTVGEMQAKKFIEEIFLPRRTIFQLGSFWKNQKVLLSYSNKSRSTARSAFALKLL